MKNISTKNRPVVRARKGPARLLLAWYDIHRRALPWRAQAGQGSDPYRVWLSEIMLQQTTVAAVGPYYAKFLRDWPTVEALAAAEQDDVLAAWAGLGYYARARNLHRAARVVARDHGGRFPETAEALRRLPGVGDYTAGAVAAIAFGAPEVAIDANAERVLARFFALDEPLPKIKSRLRALGRSLLPATRPGDFAQALMDLGATICTPKSPGCPDCPWRAECRARALGIAEQLPRKAEKRPRPLRRGAAFVVRHKDSVLLERRPDTGLLGGMLQPPMTPWGETQLTAKDAMAFAPFADGWRKLPGIVRHAFTHFELEIEVYGAEVGRGPAGGFWVRVEDLANAALPTLMRKILHHAGMKGLKANDKKTTRKTKQKHIETA